MFAEGDFTATYKFALLTSLADLALQRGHDDGRELVLSIRDIADRFVELYWRHATPYGTDRPDTQPDTLVQNMGAQAAVISAIVEFRRLHRVTHLTKAKVLDSFSGLISQVATVVAAQPLNYLQNFGGGTDPFLYERAGRGLIRLKPGVTYCLRRFYPFIQQLCRSHWVGHIKSNRRNHPILGRADDLEDFLFSTARQSLTALGNELRKLDGLRCFYCGEGLKEADVDHFVPFSLYPRDMAANFVLAHPSCNRSKSDTLAAKPHLERWLERIDLKQDQLAEIGSLTGIMGDRDTLSKVAGWAYSNAADCHARAWVSPTCYETIDTSYVRLF
ncbi:MULTISPECIES: HNH endonuclease [Giesbergeria]|uniref:HNH endonuclease n=1 Tax=Giesbergeria sinuosa TaxID=80883 RepID=A0ABV9QEB8_9BURK